MEVALCSNCFHDEGLRLDAERIGIEINSACPNCGSDTGRKLDKEVIAALAHRFFVWGTLIAASMAQHHVCSSISTRPQASTPRRGSKRTLNSSAGR